MVREDVLIVHAKHWLAKKSMFCLYNQQQQTSEAGAHLFLFSISHVAPFQRYQLGDEY